MFSHMFKEFTGEPAKVALLESLQKLIEKSPQVIRLVAEKLMNSIESGEKLDGNAIRQAAILDSYEKRTFYVNKVIEIGASFTKSDLEEAAVLMNGISAKL